MKHYFNPMSRALTTDWMLRELDAPHEQIVVDFAAGDNDAPDYRAINPMGKVPTLVDGDVVITETAAICAYLADKFADKGLAPPVGSTERGRYYRYLFLPSAVIEPQLSLTAGGVENSAPQSVGWGDMPRVLDTIEAMTPETGWALGDPFTTADVVFGGTLAFSTRFDWMKPSPKVTAYVERIRARPAYRASHAVFET